MGGNWKLNPVTLAQATSLASDVVRLTKNTKGVDIVVFPPCPFIAPVAEMLRGSNVRVRSQ
jgi:triosephosphate isomerase